MGNLAEIKTKESAASVEKFLDNLEDLQKREDSYAILEMMKKATREEPKMWGSSMIGFGKLIYKSPKTGREVEWFKIGFSPRKGNLSLHLININRDKLEKLGKHKTGVGCLYINRLSDVDRKVLEGMIRDAAKGK